jgi:hypothetical protein
MKFRSVVEGYYDIEGSQYRRFPHIIDSFISETSVICLTESNKTTVRNVIFCVHSLLHQFTQHVSAPHGGHPQV